LGRREGGQAGGGTSTKTEIDSSEVWCAFKRKTVQKKIRQEKRTTEKPPMCSNPIGGDPSKQKQKKGKRERALQKLGSRSARIIRKKSKGLTGRSLKDTKNWANFREWVPTNKKKRKKS